MIRLLFILLLKLYAVCPKKTKDTRGILSVGRRWFKYVFLRAMGGRYWLKESFQSTRQWFTLITTIENNGVFVAIPFPRYLHSLFADMSLVIYTVTRITTENETRKGGYNEKIAVMYYNMQISVFNTHTLTRLARFLEYVAWSFDARGGWRYRAVKTKREPDPPEGVSGMFYGF